MAQLVTSAQFNRVDPAARFLLGRQQRSTLDLQQAQLGQLQAEQARQAQLQQILGQAFPGQAQTQLGATTDGSAGGVQGISGPVLGAQSSLTQQQAQRQLQTQFPEKAQQISAAEKARFDNQTSIEKQRFISVAQGAAEIQGLPPQQQISKLQQQRIRQSDPNIIKTIDEQLRLLQSGRIDEANSLTDQAVQLGERLGVLKAPGGALTAEQREFAGLTEDLTAEQKKEATLIKLGLSPRAVGSAVQTITDRDIAEQVGDTEAVIAQRKKFGTLTGASRAKAIDAGFERIGKINVGIQNIDGAIEAVRAGAGTGALESRFPSIKAASVELDNIQGRMALDVIGAVTFGALSKGELDLAKQVALPTGLDGPELIKFLEDKRAAQIKLRDYFKEQIDFLDQGGTVAGFLRSKERGQTQDAGATQQGQELQEGAIIVNPQTGQRLQVVNGQLVEAQ